MSTLSVTALIIGMICSFGGLLVCIRQIAKTSRDSLVNETREKDKQDSRLLGLEARVKRIERRLDGGQSNAPDGSIR